MNSSDKFDLRSNLKRYSVEFLVIFLSITLSFFAENLREDASNREIEQEALLRLSRDVAADLRAFPGNLDRTVIGLDAIRWLSMQEVGDLPSADSVEHYLERYWTCSTTDASKSEFESLKSSGNLRLLQDSGLASQLAANYENYDTLEFYHRKDCDLIAEVISLISNEITVRSSGFGADITVSGSLVRIFSNEEFRIALASHNGMRMVILREVRKSIRALTQLSANLPQPDSE